MKKQLTLIILTILSNVLYSQEVKKDVENSIFNAQIGIAGIWVNNETKIIKNTVLRSEIGMSAGFWGGTYYDNVGFILTPLLRLEPKYYYNIERRISKEKSVENNSANFFSLKTTFHPNWFVISNYDNIKIISDFSVIPTYGFRRNISSKLNYEFSFGLGYRYLFLKDVGYNANKSEIAPDLSFRIGYTF